MAVLSVLPSVKVTIQVDGQDLHEYDDEAVPTTAKVISKFIEVSSGQQFSLKVTSNKSHRPFREYCLCWALYIDGQSRYSYSHLDSSWYDRIFKDDMWLKGGAWYKKPLKFNELLRHENERSITEAQKKAAIGLGTIEICVFRFKIKKNASKYQPSDNQDSIFDHGVSEKVIKGRAISQSVVNTQNGAFYKKAPLEPVRIYTDKDNDPLATFRFKYRSKADLQLLGVIEKTPIPPPLTERNLDDLTDEELRTMIRNRELIVKRERSDPEIKTETADATSPSRKRKFHVDLIEDTQYEEPVVKKERVDVDLSED